MNKDSILQCYLSVLLWGVVFAGAAYAQQPGATAPAPVNPAPSSNNPPPPGAPGSGSTGSNQPAPSGNSSQVQPPVSVSPAPGSNARPVTPAGQVEQSVQPTTQSDQQNRGASPVPAIQPQTPQATPSDGMPVTDTLPSSGTVLDSTPGSGLRTADPALSPSQNAFPRQPPLSGAQNPSAPGRESVPGPAPDQLLTVPQIAPNFRAGRMALPELGRVGVDLMQQRPLSIRDAISMALTNNKDIEVARDNVRQAEFDLLGARGAYDPRLSSLSYYERTATPSSSFLSGGPNGAVTQADFTGTARFEGLVPKYGGGYRVDFSAIRLTTDNQFVALNPQFPTALTFSYTQPLVRGLRFDQNRRQISVSKKNLSLTDSQFRQRTIETITNVQRAYWDLVFSLRNLQIQRDAIRDARTQLEHNKRLVSEGLLAPIDVVAAEAQVSGFEQSVYSALEDVSRAENNLKGLIAENRQAGIWNLSIVPTDAVDLAAPPVTLADAMEAALANRPELQQSDVSRQINEIDQRYFREQSKPEIDLIGSYGVVGLAGTVSNNGVNPLSASSNQLRDRINALSAIQGLPPLATPPPQAFQSNLIGGYFQSLDNLVANRYNNFRVGVQINLPIRNRTAEAQLGRSLVEGQRIRTQREQLEELIQVDVRNALQLMRTSQSRVRASADARSANEQQYASEQRKFDAGQSTLFLVLQRQTELTNAKGNELRAQTDLNKAIADLQRATGNSLQANNVVAHVR